MEETEERRVQHEAIEQANAEALAARARSTKVLNIPEEAWVRARTAIQNNIDIPEDATRDELLAYNHLLRAHGRMMAEQQDSLDERKRRADASSLNRYILSTGGSRASSGRGSAAEPIPRARRVLPEGALRDVARNLGTDLDAEADLIPRTPDAAPVALTTYLSLNQPPEGDPRATAHKAALVAADLLTKKAAPPR